MAGQGAAPKLPDQRRTRHAPQRGEWIELPPVGLGPPAPLPHWSERACESWKRWWDDPASTQWDQSDVDAVYALADLMSAGLLKHAAEIRLRAAELGLGAKGRQDRRWRIVEAEVEAEPKKPAKTRRRTLNVVA